MTLEYIYDIVSSFSTTIEIDEDELEKPWAEMTDDEKREVAAKYEDEAYNEASYKCDYSLGELETVEDETGEQLYTIFS
jgi:hypothetical protein